MEERDEDPWQEEVSEDSAAKFITSFCTYCCSGISTGKVQRTSIEANALNLYTADTIQVFQFMCGTATFNLTKDQRWILRYDFTVSNVKTFVYKLSVAFFFHCQCWMSDEANENLNQRKNDILTEDMELMHKNEK